MFSTGKDVFGDSTISKKEKNEEPAVRWLSRG
jgi:hypothetical protein